MDLWLFNCKKVSRLVSDSMDRDLGFWRRLGIRFHLMMCRYCFRYDRQLRMIRQRLRGGETEDVAIQTLSEEQKKRLRELIRKHLDQD